MRRFVQTLDRRRKGLGLEAAPRPFAPPANGCRKVLHHHAHCDPTSNGRAADRCPAAARRRAGQVALPHGQVPGCRRRPLPAHRLHRREGRRRATSPSRSSACRRSAAPAERSAAPRCPTTCPTPPIGKKGVFKLSAESKAEVRALEGDDPGHAQGQRRVGKLPAHATGPWTTAPRATPARWPGRPSAVPSRPATERASISASVGDGQLKEHPEVGRLAVRPAPTDHGRAGEHLSALPQDPHRRAVAHRVLAGEIAHEAYRRS